MLIEKLNSINFGYNVSKGGKGFRGFHLTQEQKEKISKSHSGENNIRSKKVFFNGTIFNSIRECADYMQVNYRTLKTWLSHGSTPPREIIDLGIGLVGEDLLTEYHIQKRKNYTVLCEDLEFSNVTKCAKYYGYSKTYLNDMLSGKVKMNSFFKEKGLKFKYSY